MTDANPQSSLTDEVRRCDEALRAAEALATLGLCSDSVSRSYFAVFHALRALLLTRGVELRSEVEAIHLFDTELVQSGALPSSHSLLLAGLQRARELADDDAAVAFDEKGAREVLAAARTFIDAARELLSREGWQA
ncbi:MAG: HEPN domain-containing protein [Myxococcaceae bacterium]|nr:HEPN domain-containing protein [Myxococcaceae bacterium]MCI0668929.1 HEPN domain-containing protein [Myxococcaceae bacterium]